MVEAKKAVSQTKKRIAKTDDSFAVIEAGGKQYVVKPGQTLKIEKLDTKEGSKISFDKVLFRANGSTITIGTPHLKGMKVEATVKGHGRGKKVLVMKYKAKSRYRKKIGFRPSYSRLLVVKIKT